MTRLLLILLTTVLIAVGASAETPDTEALLEAGNRAYNEAHFEDALARYTEAKQAGAESPNLEYNIGNAMFRLGRLGEALASFRRAQRDLPRDADLLHNLALAEQRLKRAPTDSGNSTLLRVLGIPSQYLSRYELQVIALSCYILFWLLLVWNRLRRKKSGWLLPGTVLVLALIAASFGWGAVQIPGGDSVPRWVAPGKALAIVKSNDTKSFSGDSETFQVVAVVSGGEELMIGELRPEWVEVYLRDGRRGWIKRSELEFVGELES